MKRERLDKLLADTGLYTRSRARELIRSGAVTVDGTPERRPEAKVSRQARITAGGEAVDTAEFVYYMMNKPAGWVCSARDEGPYPSVLSLLPEALRRRGLFPVGRLDADVTGLLLLTDDGAFAHRVTAPRSGIPKRYEIFTDGPLSEEDAAALAEGVILKDGTAYRPAELAIDPADPAHGFVTVTEGKYHEVKNLIASRGRRITAMARRSIGGLSMEEGLDIGQFHQIPSDRALRVFI